MNIFFLLLYNTNSIYENSTFYKFLFFYFDYKIFKESFLKSKKSVPFKFHMFVSKFLCKLFYLLPLFISFFLLIIISFQINKLIRIIKLILI